MPLNYQIQMQVLRRVAPTHLCRSFMAISVLSATLSFPTTYSQWIRHLVYTYTSVKMLEPFRVWNLHFFWKLQFEMINHEILSKTNRLTSLMTKRPKIFKRTFVFFVGFLFSCTSQFFFTQMECSAVVNFNLKTLRTKITWLCPFSHINTLSDKKNIYV